MDGCISTHRDIAEPQFPCQFRTAVEDVLQLRAIGKRQTSDTFYAARDCHAGQARAVVECIVSNTGHAIRDCHAGQACAAIECIVSNTGHAIRDCHAGQACAAIECMVTYVLNIIFNYDLFNFRRIIGRVIVFLGIAIVLRSVTKITRYVLYIFSECNGHTLGFLACATKYIGVFFEISALFGVEVYAC